MTIRNDEEPVWAAMNDLCICHQHGARASITAASEGKQNRPDCVERDATSHVTRCFWKRSAVAATVQCADATESRAFPNRGPAEHLLGHKAPRGPEAVRP